MPAIVDLGNLLVLGKILLLHHGEVFRLGRLAVLLDCQRKTPELAGQARSGSRVRFGHIDPFRLRHLGVQLADSEMCHRELLDQHHLNWIGRVACLFQ